MLTLNLNGKPVPCATDRRTPERRATAQRQRRRIRLTVLDVETQTITFTDLDPREMAEVKALTRDYHESEVSDADQLP